MAMGRNLRVYHNLQHPSQQPHQQPYSILLEQRGKKDEMLLVENFAIVSLDSQDHEAAKRNYVKLTDAFGCLGILRVNEGDRVLYFLVMVTGCNSAGKVGSCEIYRLTQVALISMRGIASDEEKITEIKKLLTCGTFYFAWSSSPESNIDLTLTAQKYVKPKSNTDNRFFWNRMFHIPFIRHGIHTDNWLLKIMCGSVEIRTIYVGSKQAKAVVISRLSSERAGTRFQVRGVDDNGYVANFAETEMAIHVGDEVTSMVQIRGSVPLFWDQPGVNVGSHKIRMSRGPELSVAAFDSHLKQLKQNYGNQVIVNLLGSSLVGSKEGEATLSTAFQTHHKQCDHHLDIPHILFDYHAEVKSGNVKNLSKLKSKIESYVNKFGFFSKSGNLVKREQFGTVRTNCTDCLDRTNAVQTFIGLEILNFMLTDLQLNDKANIVSRFQETFKQMWLTNGNELSKMYAGTGALGGGGSKIIDGARSAARTIQNNLLDATKQEAIDVILFGSSFNSDLADRARVLLPNNYMNAPRPILENLVNRYLEYSEPLPLRVAVGTYNINGGKHFRSIVYKDLSLSDWLLDAHKDQKGPALIDLSEHSTDANKPIDVYAIGFEEMVDLDAKNIMNASSENAKSWAQELTKVLNRDERFTLITYQQLVGVCLYVFVRPEFAPHIRDVAVDSVKTGLGGATGNKGAVAIRFRYHSTSLCFVCSHFAAGQGNITDRNNDFNEAVKRIMFPKGRTLLSHDYVFWCGDFNYRINMAREDVKNLVYAQDWETLLSADQLKIEHGAGNVFNGFNEGTISFAPTYKYDLFSEDYDTSEKCRVPAWTDRVLWRRKKIPGTPDSFDWNPGSCHWYGRAELKQSDHRPILCVLDIEVLKVDETKRKNVFDQALKTIGPPDGSVLIQFEHGGSFDIQNVIDDHFMQCLTSKLEEYGKIRFTKFLNEMIWVGFMDHSKPLEVVKLGSFEICGHSLSVQLKTPNWRDLLEKELELCSNNTLQLCGDKDLNLRRESARLLSQLSQLSFEELEDITMTQPVESAPPPPRPPAPPVPRSSEPPSRPAEPPSRPVEPPSRPATGPLSRPTAPPSRPALPPSRPAPPPSRPVPPPPTGGMDSNVVPIPRPISSADPSPAGSGGPENNENQSESQKSAGFSDIFAVTSPLESELPISLSSGSLVGMAGAPIGAAPEKPKGEAMITKQGSASSGSLEYPENYDPLTESGKAWINGKEQTIPVQSNEDPIPPSAPIVQSAPRSLPPVPTRQSSSSAGSSSTTSPASPKSIPRAPPQLPPGKPPPGPPPSRGPPPALPNRTRTGPPPPVPKR